MLYIMWRLHEANAKIRRKSLKAFKGVVLFLYAMNVSLSLISLHAKNIYMFPGKIKVSGERRGWGPHQANTFTKPN